MAAMVWRGRDCSTARTHSPSHATGRVFDFQVRQGLPSMGAMNRHHHATRWTGRASRSPKAIDGLRPCSACGGMDLARNDQNLETILGARQEDAAQVQLGFLAGDQNRGIGVDVRVQVSRRQ